MTAHGEERAGCAILSVNAAQWLVTLVVQVEHWVGCVCLSVRLPVWMITFEQNDFDLDV